MRKLILSALLVSAPVALAGGYQPPVGPAPAPAQPRPVTGSTFQSSTLVIPALPLNAPAQRPAPVRSIAVGEPTPGKPVPAPVTSIAVGEPTPGKPVPMTPAQARTFMLTAPSGTSVTLRQTSKVQIELEDVQATGSAAKEMSQDDIKEMRQMFAEMGDTEVAPTDVVISVGQVFPDGSRELITSVTTQMPAESEMDDFTLRVIQRIAADGRLTATRIESDNKEIQQTFAALSQDQLNNVSGGQDTGVYGFPLVPGQSKTSTQTVDMQALLGGLMGGLVGSMSADLSEDEAAEVQATFQNIKADPLTVTSVTTYRGTDAQGRYVFDAIGKAQPWKVSFSAQNPDGSGAMQTNASITDLNVMGQSSYRANGLPSSLNTTQEMRMRLNVTMTGKDAGTMNMVFRMKTTTQAAEVIE
ncbi:hypothetical protein [Deinococcus sp. Marseille-Q6407]|uniref:hypothetical protein n=1 Tax=Deinococcus sp. Marseille-Q6407 TaxID=2969223 RepID=UPI0021C14F70|nr:hypothetical protein [Deinococcus sp. Marseille-Q6407]